MHRRETAMKKTRFTKLCLIGLLVLIEISIAIQAGKKSPTYKQKNIQVLKGMTDEQVYNLMDDWVNQVGVTHPDLACNSCHAGPFENETPRKKIVRWMQREYVNGL